MGISISISLSQGSQSIANNTTNVTATVKYSKTASTYNNNKKPLTIVIDGTTYKKSASFPKGTTSGTLGSASKTVSHNSEGKKTVSASAKFESGVNSGTVTAKTSKTLTTIPRASTMSCPSTFTVGSTGTISISRKSSSFTHTASNSLGNSGMSATSGISTSFKYTPPISLFDSSSYASTKSRSGTITVQTKSGSTSIGSALKQSITVNLPENSTTKPTCTLSSNLVEYDTDYLTRYGVLIEGKSKLKTTCTSTAKCSANIANHYFTIPGGVATRDSSNNVIIDNLKTSSTGATFSYYVKDSRGFTSNTVSIENPYTVVDYKTPSVTNFIAVRVNDDGVEDPVQGTHVKFKVDYFVDPVSISEEYAANTAVVKIYQLIRDDDGVITGRTLLKNSAGGDLSIINGQFTDIVSGIYPVTNSYDFEATIVDEITTDEEAPGAGILTSVLTAKALMSFYKGEGLAIGKIAEGSGLEVAMDAVFENDATFVKDIYIVDEELEGLYDQLVGGGLISDDFNTWYKANPSNGKYTITNQNGVPVLKLTATTDTVGAYTPIPNPHKEDLQGTIVFSVWVKKLTNQTLTPVQFRVITSATDGKDHYGGGYWSHTFASPYSNKPVVESDKWIRYEVKFTWDDLISKATQYSDGFTEATAVGMGVRLFGGGTTVLGDIAEYKLPCLTVE